jgi:N-glycosylase/DNA lyase
MLRVADFSLRHTVESGQPLTFHSRYSAGNGIEKLVYTTQKGRIDVRFSGTGLRYFFEGNYTKASAGKEVVRRLGIETNMDKAYAAIGTDKFMLDAIGRCRGMRVTANDPWETALCFVISQFNNIKRIRGIIGRLMGQFGEEFGGTRLFPGPEAIAAADLGSIRACGTGFRDKYIKNAAEQFAYSFEPERLYSMGYDGAKDALMELDGVGDKVADCILLFGYGKMEAFPIDVWIKRTIEQVYFKGRKKSVARIHEFADLTWPGWQGYAQQYIYHFGRMNSIG